MRKIWVFGGSGGGRNSLLFHPDCLGLVDIDSIHKIAEFLPRQISYF